MDLKYFILATLFAVVCFGNAGLVLFIKNKCQADDETCITEAANFAVPIFTLGLPEYKVTSLDPLVFKEVDASTSNLKFFLTDLVLTGLKDAKILRAALDKKNSKLYLDMMCDLVIDGKYDMDGKLISLVPIKGNGTVHSKLDKMLYKAELDMPEYIGKDEKAHWQITNYKYTYKSTGKAEISFSNLFPGNKNMSVAIEKLLQSHPNEVVEELGAPVVESMTKYLLKNVNQLFKIVPVEDLSSENI